MAMPAIKSAWPPKPFDDAFTDIEEWAVWWEGTSAKLTNFYFSRGTMYNALPMGLRQRSAAATQAFFGRQDGRYMGGPASLQLHLPVPGAIARKMANIMFSTPPKFSIETEDKMGGSEYDEGDDSDDEELTEQTDPRQERIDELLNCDATHALLLEAAESWSALGGTYLRVVWDEATVPDRAFLDKVDHDHAIPLFAWGVLKEVTFWSEIGITKDGGVLRHFQRYIPGYIDHAVYEGTKSNVGIQVNLSSVQVIDFSDIIESMDETGMVPTGYDGLAAVYVPRRKPNPAWRAKTQLKYMGYSDFSRDVIPLFASIDETWTSLMRDVRQGKGRLIIAENLLELLGPGRGSGFDMTREMFSPVGESLDDTGRPLLEQVQFNIRVQEHLDTIRALLLEVLRRVGISPLTFGLSESVATTATEVKAWTADTLETQDAGQRYWGPALCEIACALLAIDDDKFPDGVSVDDIELDWPASVELSDIERAQAVSLWADAASLHTKIAYLHPDWDEAKIEEEVNKIGDEKAAAMPPALSEPFGGGESGDNKDPSKPGAGDAGNKPEGTGKSDPNAAANGGMPMGKQPASK